MPRSPLQTKCGMARSRSGPPGWEVGNWPSEPWHGLEDWHSSRQHWNIQLITHGERTPCFWYRPVDYGCRVSARCFYYLCFAKQTGTWCWQNAQFHTEFGNTHQSPATGLCKVPQSSFFESRFMRRALQVAILSSFKCYWRIRTE